jgi:uncharacterized protein YuzE
MKIEYDPQADAMYVQFKEGAIEDTLEVGSYIFVDVGDLGRWKHSRTV